MRVVATAGHVDHGKSSLVLALTGTDPDRFAEEKERGLTIDLGFAFTTLPSGTEVGFVDVPGHVRFLKNMLAGVGAVEVALFVVAATEGWMPQSEEHLRILELLGVRHGVVAVTKADLVDDDLLELALVDVEEHLAGSSLAGARVVACDSLSRRGLDDLAAALDDALAVAPATRDDDRPRLWVDRVFAAKGAGTVVTGTLVGGGLAVDDELTVARLDTRVRVRGIESAHRKLERIGPGSRVALNLAGIDHHELRRGDALVRAGQWCVTEVVDVVLQPVGTAPLPPRGRWQAYVGSGEHECRWRAFGDGDPPHTGARVTFTETLALAPGDRLVLRDPGRGETVAGAVVLDAEAPGRIADAARLLGLPLGARLVAARAWVARSALPRLAGCTPAAAEVFADETVAAGDAVALAEWLVDPTVFAAAQQTVRDAVAALHRDQPLARGLELTVLGGALRVDAHRARLVADTVDDVVVDQGLVRDTARRHPSPRPPRRSRSSPRSTRLRSRHPNRATSRSPARWCARACSSTSTACCSPAPRSTTRAVCSRRASPPPTRSVWATCAKCCTARASTWCRSWSGSTPTASPGAGATPASRARASACRSPATSGV
ncbi:MAG: selenocysteine-specific translation elongation factor [Acidimicrobiia bacterium]